MDDRVKALLSKLTQRQISFLAGLAAGIAIWLFTSVFSEGTDAFDNWGYYIPALSLAGFAIGAFRGRDWYAVAAGVISGQVVFAVLNPRSWEAPSFLPIGIVIMIVSGAIPLIFAGLGEIVGRLLRRSTPRHGDNPHN